MQPNGDGLQDHFYWFRRAINWKEGEKGEVKMCMQVEAGMCVTGPTEYPRSKVFVPVHTLETRHVPMLFIYISAWMVEWRTQSVGH